MAVISSITQKSNFNSMKKMAAQLLSSAFAPLWKTEVPCFPPKNRRVLMGLNNKISPVKKRVSFTSVNLDLGDVGLKGAPFFDFLAKELRYDSVTGRKIVRRFDVVYVGIDSDHKITETKVPEISPSSSSPSDCGNSESIGGVASVGVDSDQKIRETEVTEVSPSSYQSDCANSDSNSDVASVTVSSTAVTSKGSACSRVLTDYESLLEEIPFRIYRPEAASPVLPSQDVEWAIMKILTTSDCYAQHRLLVRNKLVVDHILPHLDETSRQAVNTLDGLRVDVVDSDLGTELELTLKKWPSTLCYGLTDDWKRDFAQRRGLNLGDEVGLRWDEHQNRLQFTVLRRSPLTDYLAKGSLYN